MAYPYQIEQFITGYLESQGALSDRPSYGIVELLLDSHSQDELGAEHLTLAFDYEAARESEGAEFISYGNPLYERIAELAVNKHVCAERFVAALGRAPDNLPKKLSTTLNCRANQIEVTETKLYLTRCFRFGFKASYLNEQREENLIRIWVDGFNGKEIGYGSLSHIFHDQAASSLLPELPSYPIAKLLNVALHSLTPMVEVRQAKMEEQTRKLAQQDRERTEQYFQTLLEEASAKQAKAIEARALAEAQSKLASIEAQKSHHLQDIAARYKVGCEVTLLDLVCYVVPRWRLSFKDARRGSSVQSADRGTVWWDELLKQFV